MPVKSMRSFRRGAALAMALMLFLLCALASWGMAVGARVSSKIYADAREFDRQYIAASSAAWLILDSMSDLNNVNMLTMVILQYANGTGEGLTVTLKGEGLPQAVCHISFDSDLNLNAEIETEAIQLRLTMPAAQPGKIGWAREDANIERIPEKETENVP